MAKKQYFDEDKMLTAVIQYANVYKGKIKYSELARYASDNINGLQGIEARHFTRKIKDPKTGKMINRPARDKVEEINRERKLEQDADLSIILQGKIDEFFDLPEISKRSCLSDIRKEIALLRNERNKYQYECEAYKNENIKLKAELEEFKERFKDYKNLKTKIDMITNRLIESDCRKILAEEGITPEDFDADKYQKFLSTDREAPESVLDSLIIGEGVF